MINLFSLERIYSPLTGVLRQLGGMGLMFFSSVILAFRRPLKFNYIFKQMEFIGVKSLGVVVITGTFTGMVLALQSYYGFRKFGAEGLVGTTVALSMTRELGPVLTSL
ncbi:MAG TPA: ABC transporter permease, partial [Syntrophorhabdaceae bacterium]|nr:ABC transporter permease [Syntrophorhabdaceae bacterium]